MSRTNGLRTFKVGEEVVRPESGFALIEAKDYNTGEAWVKSNGEVHTKVLFGAFEIERFRAGEASAMQVITLPEFSQVKKAVRVITNSERFGERFIYLEQLAGAPEPLEMVGVPNYVWAGTTIAKDEQGYNRVRSINKGNKPNPKSVTYAGFVRERSYTTIQRTLLDGGTFACDLDKPYEMGLWMMGRAAALFPGMEANTELRHMLTDDAGLWCGRAEIGDTHALSVIGHLAMGRTLTLRTPDGDQGPIMGVTHARNFWKYILQKYAAEIAAGDVEIILNI